MDRIVIEQSICDIKDLLQKEIKKQQHETALRLISLCANILYSTNITYMDSDLEEALQQIAQSLMPSETCKDLALAAEEDTILFYDGFGIDNRGLAQIYLKAIGEKKRICYVTYKKKSERIPETLSLIHSQGGNVCFLEAGNRVDQIKQLNAILKKSKARHFFYYAYPDDVVATTLLYRYEGLLKRYQINLTDHAFWLGAGCMDVCIEFRDYGGSISAEYRNIPKSKIVLLPFYPNINRSQQFQGFPFDVKVDNKVIFSGGALYKTLGKGNKYYEIIDYLLSKHQNAIFWYAGIGDETLMRAMMAKYPGRVFLTSERKDLFQILERCHFYLSTYPICGGLMYQYAACAGKVPLTLRNEDDNDGFLLNQETMEIDYESIEDLKQEIDRLMEEDGYASKKGDAMRNCVISQEQFQRNLFQIMIQGSSSYKINYKHINVEDFRQVYLDNLTLQKLAELYVRKETANVVLRYMPMHFVRGVWSKASRKIRNFL